MVYNLIFTARLFLKQLTSIQTNEEVIKKSTFIALVAPVLLVDEAMEFLQSHSNFSATHNCWAYNIGQDYRFNDDGEPSGTAGMPILKAIQGQDFDNTIALVIRHYGGIKLGTGGLMRAYGGSVNRCLQEADFKIMQDRSETILKVPFHYIQGVHNLASSIKAEIISEEFDEQGAVITLKLLTENVEKCQMKAINLSKGKISIIINDEL